MKRKGRILGRLRKQLRKPFKGGRAFEWQIGPAVIMVYHDAHTIAFRTKQGRRFPHVEVWHDHHWWGIPKRGPYA